MKRLFIVHRWSGTPEKDWLPWAKEKFTAKGYEVIVPLMPHPEEPKIEERVSFLAECVGNVDEETYFIGHSIGCQTILRYLETVYPQKIGGMIFVAGWFNLQNLEDKESERIARSWIATPIDCNKIRLISTKITAIFSDDDPFVPLSDIRLFQEQLNVQTIMIHNKGHITQRENVFELPELLNVF